MQLERIRGDRPEDGAPGVSSSFRAGTGARALGLLALAFALCGAADSGGPAYRLIQAVRISPQRQIFDYAAADSRNRRIYLAHGEEVVVIDADSNSVVGRIPAPTFDPTYGVGLFGRTTPYQGVHHVAIAPDLGPVFI
jgi:hypothetical protein